MRGARPGSPNLPAVGLLDRLRTTAPDAALAAAFTVVGLVQVVAGPDRDPGVGRAVRRRVDACRWRGGVPIPSRRRWWRRRSGWCRSTASRCSASSWWSCSSSRWAAAASRAGGGGGHAGRRACRRSVGTLLGPEAPVAAIGGVLVVVAPVLAGRLVRHQRRQNAGAGGRSPRSCAAERDRAEEAAVGAERARIAQELHDVVGHEVTLIAIQAEAAGRRCGSAPNAPPSRSRRSAARPTGRWPRCARCSTRWRRPGTTGPRHRGRSPALDRPGPCGRHREHPDGDR